MAPGSSLRVLLIDDHTLFRTGLQELLERRGLTVVAATGDGQEGVCLVGETHPDIVLLDLRMPRGDGVSVLKNLKRADPSVPVIMLTTSAEESDLIRCLRGGAQGYLLKDIEPDRLIDLLNDAMQGTTVVAPAMTGVLARLAQGESVSTPAGSRFSVLTPRELEILGHVAAGQGNKAIGRDLGITDGTVKLHVRSIMKKLNVKSRVGAAVLAVEEGFSRKSAGLNPRDLC